MQGITVLVGHFTRPEGCVSLEGLVCGGWPVEAGLWGLVKGFRCLFGKLPLSPDKTLKNCFSVRKNNSFSGQN